MKLIGTQSAIGKAILGNQADLVANVVGGLYNRQRIGKPIPGLEAMTCMLC